ncbi:scaffold attachment factor B1 isoform X2 [Folsomia candida]|nr:scaffold attachment factor B1 isoform X2 [Folsomia candida]
MGDVETAGKDKPTQSSGGETTEADASEELPPESEEGPEALTVMEVVKITESEKQENEGQEETVDKPTTEQESVVQDLNKEEESVAQAQNKEESVVPSQNKEEESVIPSQNKEDESVVPSQNKEDESIVPLQKEEEENVVPSQNKEESVIPSQKEEQESIIQQQTEEHENSDHENKKDKSPDQEREIDNSNKKDEEQEKKDDSKALPEKKDPVETDKIESKNDTSTDAGVDDDNYALNLTIGDEEDKFIMDGEDGAESETNPDTTLDNSFHLKLAVVPLSSITCENADESKSASPGPINATQAEPSSEEKQHTEKSSEEGGGNKPPRKSKDEDRNTLLVTGLSSQTAATEIKAVFKKHGKIGGVKIMSNAKDPEGSRFALVSVMSSEDATICIKNLDGFALNGHIMHVEKARDEMLTADWVNSHSSKNKNKDGKKSGNGIPPGLTPPPTPKEDSANISIDPATEKSDSSKDIVEVKSVDQKPDVEMPATKSSPTGPAVSSSSDAATKAKVESKSKRRSSKDSGSGSHKHRLSRSPEERKGRSREVVFFKRREFHPSPFRGGMNSRLIRSRHPRYRYHDEDEEERREEYRRRLMERREMQHRRRHGSPHRHHRHSLVRRSRSPLQRIPFHRGGSSPEGRRSRQPELTFEEIYDTHQREKDREMERERREIERRRMEEAQKQHMLDEEFRLLAKERGRIEAEKAELKRQKERMIMEEREKQRIEQAEIEREKAILARKVKVKRLNLEEQYRNLEDSEESKKAGRHSFVDPRSDKDKMRPHPYRKEDPARFLDRTSGIRGAPIRSAPVREVRDHVSPSWEPNERRDTKTRGHVKGRDDTAIPSGSGGTRYSAPFDTSGAAPQRIVTTLPRTLDYLSRDPSWRPGGTSFTGDSSMSILRTENWLSNRESTWGASERIASRTGTEIPERWGGGTSNLGTSAGARLSIPVAPPPPIFSTTSDNLNLNFNTGMYNSNYNYKLPSSMSSHRR